MFSFSAQYNIGYILKLMFCFGLVIWFGTSTGRSRIDNLQKEANVRMSKKRQTYEMLSRFWCLLAFLSFIIANTSVIHYYDYTFNCYSKAVVKIFKDPICITFFLNLLSIMYLPRLTCVFQSLNQIKVNYISQKYTFESELND